MILVNTLIKVALEKHFEKLLQDKFTEAGAHVVRLPDDLKVALAQGKSNKALGKEKPYDFGACFQGHYYAIECKLVKGLTFFSEEVRACQWEGLKAAQEAGATPLLAIYFKHKDVKGRGAQRRETFVEKWAVVDISLDIDILSRTGFRWVVDILECCQGESICVRDQLKDQESFLEWLIMNRGEDE